MVFSSPYFVFLFFPLALTLCLGLRGKAYLPAILLVSMAFYSWSSGLDVVILVAIVVGNYFGARWIMRERAAPLFVGLIAANLLLLLWFKYAAFIFRNLDFVLGTQLRAGFEIRLPAGVSFFVFQAISYLVDVRRGELRAETNFVTYGAYQAFFPHLIAGPIVRFRDVVGDFRAPRIGLPSFAAGTTRFAHGLLKKTCIADVVAPVADAAFAFKAHQVEFSSAWLGVLAYSLQIYFDFSGYSDMAIGMAEMFGIRFHENFERPYASRSITEFWRRWHISLSTWFRDYVYIPLGGSRGSPFVTYRNLLIVFAVTGLWHGAAWTFVLWGLYHGAFLVLERLVLRDPRQSLRHWAFRYAYCLPVVVFGWVLFRAPTLRRTVHIWGAMLNPFDAASLADVSARTDLTPHAAVAMAAGGLIFLLPGRTSFGSRLTAEPDTGAGRTLNLVYTAVALVVAGVVVLTGSYSPFLYFNF